MSNYIVTELTLNKLHFAKTLALLVSPDTAFDLNKAVPAPKSLPEYDREVLLALAHHLIANHVDQVQLDEIADSLHNHVNNVDDFTDLADEFAELLNGVTPQRASQLLQYGLDAFQNVQAHGAVFAADWKQNCWGVDAVESVEVVGRVVKLYSRANLMGFVAAWVKLSNLDLSLNMIDSGCHHCITADFKDGECISIHHDQKGDLRELAQSLLGYTQDELV